MLNSILILLLFIFIYYIIIKTAKYINNKIDELLNIVKTLIPLVGKIIEKIDKDYFNSFIICEFPLLLTIIVLRSKFKDTISLLTAFLFVTAGIILNVLLRVKKV